MSNKILMLTLVLFLICFSIAASMRQQPETAALVCVGKFFLSSDTRPKKSSSGLWFDLIREKQEIAVVPDDAPDLIQGKSVLCYAMVASKKFSYELRIQTKKYQFEVINNYGGGIKKCLHYFKESENEGVTYKEGCKARGILGRMVDACKWLSSRNITGSGYLLDNGLCVLGLYSGPHLLTSSNLMLQGRKLFRDVCKFSRLQCEQALYVLMKNNKKNLDCWVWCVN